MVVLRGPRPGDTPVLLAIAEESGLFGQGEVDNLLASMLTQYWNDELDERHHVIVCTGSSLSVHDELGLPRSRR